MDGILNVNKPPGMTSFDVVRLVRKVSGERKVGHTGTLDPSAQGVLVLCLGRATKVAGYLLSKDKEYRAAVRLGQTTDTDDATGRLLSSSSVPPVGKREIERICQSFVGEIDQVPPLFSSVRVMGERLYEIARRGGMATPRARRIEIKEIQLVYFKPPAFEMRVLCSKGTYMRSLARDIGEKLGCGAHLLTLLRMKVGSFAIEDGVGVGQLRGVVDVENHLLPIAAALEDYPQVVVGESDLAKVAHGRGIRRQATLGSADLAEGGVVLLRDQSGRTCALARVEGPVMKPFKVLM